MAKKKNGEQKDDSEQLRWEGMTKGQMRDIGKYLRKLADQMGLRDWMIRISHSHIDESTRKVDDQGFMTGPAAMVKVTYGQKDATIKLCKDFLSENNAEDVRRYLVHELMHLHIDQMDTVFQSMEYAFGKGEWTVLTDAFTVALELATDNIAQDYARKLPLPKFMKEINT